MKNKVRLKKYLIITIILLLILTGIFLLINNYEYRIYTRNYNNKLVNIINTIKDKYPNISDNEIIEILNTNSNDNNVLLKSFGIDIYNSSIILENEQYYLKFIITNISFIILSMLLLLVVFLIYNHRKEKEIYNIIKYLEEINKRNYDLDIDSNEEDELSILKNEIYKTTIMLKEAFISSNQDKLNLKTSLEDISHQLKTPLTSILVMLDNLLDDDLIDKDIRNDFLRDIKRNIININFLVDALLKLSKFDANTITFKRQDILVKDLINEVIKNVSALCDLRNIKIDVNIRDNPHINCDFKWQIESLTNILKNCIEYAYLNSTINIECSKNNIYTLIRIKNIGNTISKRDIKHIFDRFYKGENAREDSVGIGLSLAKVIIIKDKGTVSVESKNNETVFEIKYFN